MRVLIVALAAVATMAALVDAREGGDPLDAARALVGRYDEDPLRLDRARDLLEAALARDRQVTSMTMLSYVYFLLGDVRATSTEAKLDAYERGRDWGRRAVELAPKSVDAHLWYAINTGRWGQTKGILRSLFLLPTVREEIATILTLDPRSARGHSFAGNVALEVPAIAGGDRAEAEEHFRKALESDPHFTVARVDLARALIARSRYDEARRELQRVLDERAPTSIADWTVKDRPRARSLLDTIRDKH